MNIDTLIKQLNAAKLKGVKVVDFIDINGYEYGYDGIEIDDETNIDQLVLCPSEENN